MMVTFEKVYDGEGMMVIFEKVYDGEGMMVTFEKVIFEKVYRVSTKERNAFERE